MNFFRNLNKNSLAANLARDGLANQEMFSYKEIKDCIFILANAMGDSWKNASYEAAAGMVLIALAKNKALKSLLNACGWSLVLSLVKSNPGIKRDISAMTRAEIDFYQSGMSTALA